MLTFDYLHIEIEYMLAKNICIYSYSEIKLHQTVNCKADLSIRLTCLTSEVNFWTFKTLGKAKTGQH